MAHGIVWEGSVRVEVLREAAQVAYTTGRARSKSMGDAETRRSKNWTGGPGWQRHVDGARVEMAMSIWSGHPFDDKTIGRGDRGIDFPGGIETKHGGRAGRGKLAPRLLLGFDELRRKIAASEKAGDPLAWFVLGHVHDYDPETGRLDHRYGAGVVVTLIGCVALDTFVAHRYRFEGPGGLCWAYDGQELSSMSLVEPLTLRAKEEDGVPHQRSLL